jgi:hypothetical protein
LVLDKYFSYSTVQLKRFLLMMTTFSYLSSVNPYPAIVSIRQPTKDLAARATVTPPTNVANPPKTDVVLKSHSTITPQQAKDTFKRLSLQQHSSTGSREYRYGDSEAIQKVLHLDQHVKAVSEAVVNTEKQHAKRLNEAVQITSRALHGLHI